MGYLIVFTSIFSISWAAAPFKKALDVKSNQYIEKGSVLGGQSGEAFSLLQVRTMAKKDLERIVLNLGDERGRLLRGKVSYYQVNVEQNPPRLVVDLSQVKASRMDEEALNKTFSKSPFVRNVKMLTDPEGNSTTLIFELKHKVKAEVFNMKDKNSPGRVVVDLKRM